jgi:hypothetical protein
MVLTEKLIVVQLVKKNSNVHFCFHQSPPLCPVCSQMNPVHFLTLYSFNSYLLLGLSAVLLLLEDPHPLFDPAKVSNIWRGAPSLQAVTLRSLQLLQLCFIPSLSVSKRPSNSTFSDTLDLRYTLNVTGQIIYKHKKNEMKCWK